MSKEIEKNRGNRSGAALFAVLVVVMAITAIALGYISMSDVQLACGENMVSAAETEYLAQAGLEHGRGMVLNPQDAEGVYWTGGSGLQLDGGSDYYDVSVSKVDRVRYDIVSTAWRVRDGERVCERGLSGRFYVDPCYAMYCGDGWWSSSKVYVEGDTYCGGTLGGWGSFNGDIWARYDITAGATGVRNKWVTTRPVNAANVSVSDFSSGYNYKGSRYGSYSMGLSCMNAAIGSYNGNPGGVYYRYGDLEIRGNVIIYGTLVVSNDLVIKNNSNLTIIAKKNFPALIVGDDLVFEPDSLLTVEGYVQVKDTVILNDRVRVNVQGAVFVVNQHLFNDEKCAFFRVYGDPDKAAMEIWKDSSTVERWSCATGGYFESVGRSVP